MISVHVVYERSPEEGESHLKERKKLLDKVCQSYTNPFSSQAHVHSSNLTEINSFSYFWFNTSYTMVCSIQKAGSNSMHNFLRKVLSNNNQKPTRKFKLFHDKMYDTEENYSQVSKMAAHLKKLGTNFSLKYVRNIAKWPLKASKRSQNEIQTQFKYFHIESVSSQQRMLALVRPKLHQSHPCQTSIGPRLVSLFVDIPKSKRKIPQKSLFMGTICAQYHQLSIGPEMAANSKRCWESLGAFLANLPSL